MHLWTTEQVVADLLVNRENQRTITASTSVRPTASQSMGGKVPFWKDALVDATGVRKSKKKFWGEQEAENHREGELIVVEV